MTKHKYTAEFELKSSSKVLFPYISTASGLEEWFADDVKAVNEKEMVMTWDGESHQARVVARRLQNTSCHIKFVFDEQEEAEDPQTLEFKINNSDMTGTCFLQVEDYSEMEDDKELDLMWEQLVDALRDATGS